MNTAIPAQITPIPHPNTVIIKENMYFSLTYIFLFTGKENKEINIYFKFNELNEMKEIKKKIA